MARVDDAAKAKDDGRARALTCTSSVLRDTGTATSSIMFGETT